MQQLLPRRTSWQTIDTPGGCSFTRLDNQVVEEVDAAQTAEWRVRAVRDAVRLAEPRGSIVAAVGRVLAAAVRTNAVATLIYHRPGGDGASSINIRRDEAWCVVSCSSGGAAWQSMAACR